MLRRTLPVSFPLPSPSAKEGRQAARCIETMTGDWGGRIRPPPPTNAILIVHDDGVRGEVIVCDVSLNPRRDHDTTGYHTYYHLEKVKMKMKMKMKVKMKVKMKIKQKNKIVLKYFSSF